MDENKNFIEGEKIEEVTNNTKTKETNSFSSPNVKSNYRPVSEFTVKSKKDGDSSFVKNILTLRGTIMIKADFHTHTAFSSDSTELPESIIKQAIHLGLDTICITDHYDHLFPAQYKERFTFDLNAYGLRFIR